MPLNSFAVFVQWTAPADMFSRRARVALRGAGPQDPASFPVVGYRLRYWSRKPPESGSGSVCVSLAEETERIVIEQTWTYEDKQAVLNWLAHGCEYVFEVLAFNAGGDGPWSDTSDAFFMPNMAPRGGGGVLNIEDARPELSSAKPDMIEMQWQMPCNRGSQINSYDIMCSKDPEFRTDTKQLKVAGDATKIVVCGLEPNSVYYLKYRANNELGSSQWSSRTPGVATAFGPPEQPEPPTRVGEPRPFEVAVEFFAPPSQGLLIQKYDVQHATSESFENAIEVSTSSGNHTQIKAEGLHPSTTYWFRVRAINQLGNSAWSLPSKPMTTTGIPPRQCGQAHFISGSISDGIFLAWRVHEDKRDGKSLSYDLRVGRLETLANATEFRGVQTHPAIDRSQDQAALEGERREAQVATCVEFGVDYFFQVRASSFVGTGEWSSVSKAMRLAPGLPHAPRAPHVVRCFATAIAVEWSVPDCQGSPITGYRLQYDTGMNMATAVEKKIGPDACFTVTSLSPMQTYFFRVRSVNGVGMSVWSGTSEPGNLLRMPPGKMGAPFLKERTSSSLVAAFTPPADAGLSGKEMIKRYTVRYAPGQKGASILEEAATGSGGFAVVEEAEAIGVEVTGLKPNELCAIQVRATNDHGDGPWSDIGELRSEPAPPNPPDPPRMAGRTCWSVVLSMEPAYDNGSVVTHFKFEGENKGTGKKWETGLLVAAPEGMSEGLFYDLNGLLPGNYYRFRAYALNAKGKSEWSVWSDNFNTTPMPPLPVTKMFHSDLATTSFTFGWNPPHDNGARIEEYTVKWCSDENFKNKCKEAKVSDPTTIVKGCMPGTAYFIRVAARSIAGYGAYGMNYCVVTSPDVPVAPTRVRVTEVGPTHQKLSWSKVYDSGSELTKMLVRYKETARDGRSEEERDGGELVVEGKRRSCHIDPLFSLREYVYEVAAENAVGLSPYSEPSKPMRVGPPLVPTAPGQPKLIRSTVTELVVKWDASMPMGAEITEQVVWCSVDPTFPEGNYKEATLAPRAAPTGRKGNLVPCRPPSACPPERSDSHGGPLGRTPRHQKTRGFLEYTIKDLNPGTQYYMQAASRNKVGLSPFGPVSDIMATTCRVPDPIPEDPGIVMLRSGRTTLTFGWTRPECWGAPITHYLVRVAETEDALWADTCQEFSHEDQDPMTWPGMVHRVQKSAAIDAPTLADQVSVGKFVEYVMVRFGTLEESWEWLDVNGNGDVSREEFNEGDADNGPPFADFNDSETLNRVWSLLDADGGGSIGMNEYNKLRPYMEAVRSGSAGTKFEGIQCLLPSLRAGRPYHIMCRPVNKAGPSTWTQCLTDPHWTEPMTPAKMEPLAGLPEKRTENTVTLKWTLPHDNGAPLLYLEVRWAAKNVDGGVFTKMHVRSGTLMRLEPDPATGELPTEFTVTGLEPGCLVLADARTYNRKGGAREWSDLPGPGSGDIGQLWTWDSCTVIMPPLPPMELAILEDSLQSSHAKASGRLRFSLGGSSGPPFTSFALQLVDCLGEQTVEACRLHVTVQGAAALRKADQGAEDLFNPFCKCEIPVKLGDNHDLSFQTKVINNTLDPVWDHKETLEYHEGETLAFTVLGRGTARSEVLGTVILHTADFFPGGFEGEVLMEDPKKESTPYLKVKIEPEFFLKPIRQKWTTEPSAEEVADATHSTLERPVSDMLPGELYAFRVQSLNSIGSSIWSDWSKIVRMPPDRPHRPNAVLSEVTSLTWMELKFFPPVAYSAAIEEYDIRMALDAAKAEVAEEGSVDEWNNIFETGMSKEWYEYSWDRVPTKGNRGALLCRVEGLASCTAHYFKIRARNVVGWSDWSDISRFVTRSSRPNKINLEDICLAHVGTQSLSLQWLVPQDNGGRIKRYDVVFGPSHQVMRWASLCEGVLDTVRDPAWCEIYEPVNGTNIGALVGNGPLNRILCGEVIYSPIPSTSPSWGINELLPGQKYYLLARAVSNAGKAPWSGVAGPFRTLPEKPGAATKLKLHEVGEVSCGVRFHLPFSGGAQITEVRIAWTRTAGPLATDELDPETGEVKDHIANNELVIDPAHLKYVLTADRESEDKIVSEMLNVLDEDVLDTLAEAFVKRILNTEARRIPGITAAYMQAYSDEGMDDKVALSSTLEPSWERATCKDYIAVLTGLRPGTDYEVKWACCNEVGWSSFADIVTFKTRATVPDIPGPPTVPVYVP